MPFRRIFALLGPNNDRRGAAGKGGNNEPADDDDDDEALGERISKLVSEQLDAKLNKAITGHFKREMPKFAEQIGAQVIAAMKPSAGDDDTNDDAGAGGAGAGDGAGKGAKGKGGGQSDEVTAHIKRLEKQVADEKAARLKSENATKEAEQRRLATEENDLITKALMGAGVKDETHIEAALLLHRGRGRVKRNEEGEVVYVPGKDVDPLPLAKGISDWAKSDEGKKFMPPSGAGGSGGRSPKAADGSGKSGKYTDADLSADITKAILGG